MEIGVSIETDLSEIKKVTYQTFDKDSLYSFSFLIQKDNKNALETPRKPKQKKQFITYQSAKQLIIKNSKEKKSTKKKRKDPENLQKRKSKEYIHGSYKKDLLQSSSSLKNSKKCNDPPKSKINNSNQKLTKELYFNKKKKNPKPRIYHENQYFLNSSQKHVKDKSIEYVKIQSPDRKNKLQLNNQKGKYQAGHHKHLKRKSQSESHLSKIKIKVNDKYLIKN